MKSSKLAKPHYDIRNTSKNRPTAVGTEVLVLIGLGYVYVDLGF